jgi:hypothetical protein
MSKDDKLKSDASQDAGAGLDCGTMNFVAARRGSNKGVKTSRLRNAFLDLPPEHKRMLKLSKTSYIEYDGRLLVIGDEAISTANLFNKEARRPMAAGIIAAGEIDAQGVMAVMVRHLLGDPRHGEPCCFSVPAPALDVQESDTTYHKAVLSKILTELGYSPQPVNEALAVVYSECVQENFSGLALSFGSGMTNVCLACNAMSALEFSLARGGDWVDRGAARAVGTTSAKICAIKEAGVDLAATKSREEEAIALYVQALIDYAMDNIIARFSSARGEILVPKPIPIVISGGTSLAGGFVDKFKERFELYRSKFPVQVSDIRPAKDPMTAVASGLLLYSQMED